MANSTKFYETYVKLCNSINRSPTAIALELGISRSTVSYWKAGNSPTDRFLKKIADYFGVSIDYLVTGQEPATPPVSSDLKVALFGGDGEVTDEMWEEVLQFAQFVKQKREEKK